jgi:hypothetical protein
MDELEQEHYAVQAGWNPFKAISHAITKVVHTVEDVATAPLALVSPKLAKGVKGIMHTAEKLAPLGLVPFIGPGAAALLGPATSLVKRVASGDNVAKAAVASTLQLAAQGDPQAKQMVAALTQARKIVKVSPHIDAAGVALATLATAPQLGPQAMEFIAPAASLVSRARKNDPQAQQAIRQILMAAKQPGNVPAVRMAQALALVQKLAQQCAKSASSAGGEWVALAGGCECFVPRAYSHTAAGQLFTALGRLRSDTAISSSRTPRPAQLTSKDIALVRAIVPRLKRALSTAKHLRTIAEAMIEQCDADNNEREKLHYLLKQLDKSIAVGNTYLPRFEQCVSSLHPQSGSQIQGIHRSPALTMREALQQELVTA